MHMSWWVIFPLNHHQFIASNDSSDTSSFIMHLERSGDQKQAEQPDANQTTRSNHLTELSFLFFLSSPIKRVMLRWLKSCFCQTLLLWNCTPGNVAVQPSCLNVVQMIWHAADEARFLNNCAVFKIMSALIFPNGLCLHVCVFKCRTPWRNSSFPHV